MSDTMVSPGSDPGPGPSDSPPAGAPRGFASWSSTKKMAVIGGGVGLLALVYLYSKSKSKAATSTSTTSGSNSTTPTLVLPSSNQDSTSSANYASLMTGLNNLSNQVSQIKSTSVTTPVTTPTTPVATGPPTTPAPSGGSVPPIGPATPSPTPNWSMVGTPSGYGPGSSVTYNGQTYNGWRYITGGAYNPLGVGTPGYGANAQQLVNNNGGASAVANAPGINGYTVSYNGIPLNG